MTIHEADDDTKGGGEEEKEERKERGEQEGREGREGLLLL